ncbi:MAG: leucyl aminopeptidase family protein [Pseudomonadota bacterium]
MALSFSATDTGAIPIQLVDGATADAVLKTLPSAQAAWAEFNGFKGGLGAKCILPDDKGGAAAVLIGMGTPAARARKRFAVGAAIAALPRATYRIDGQADDEIALGYLLARYRFDRYVRPSNPGAELVAPEGVDGAKIERLAAGEALTRDLINTPAEDMGPDGLEKTVRDLAAAFGADIRVIRGTELLSANFPLIHAVGRASDRAPRLIELSHGSAGPSITLVGKGVCFDTGGLNLKPGASMGLMKKDMGGAANVLGLAQMILAEGIICRLRVLIPAVENAVAGNAFRPGDIFVARNGMSVEINNTDAEGRLVLADALAYAVEEPSDILVSMATLTGAARVAVGGDIAPYFTDDERLSAALALAGSTAADPVWRLPFHTPYEALIEPGIADLDNAPKGGMAGAITAALFLRRFTDNHPRYVHFDVYGWSATAAPGRPKGGLMQGARALYAAMPEVLGA